MPRAPQPALELLRSCTSTTKPGCTHRTPEASFVSRPGNPQPLKPQAQRSAALGNFASSHCHPRSFAVESLRSCVSTRAEFGLILHADLLQPNQARLAGIGRSRSGLPKRSGGCCTRRILMPNFFPPEPVEPPKTHKVKKKKLAKPCEIGSAFIGPAPLRPGQADPNAMHKTSTPHAVSSIPIESVNHMRTHTSSTVAQPFRVLVAEFGVTWLQRASG